MGLNDVVPVTLTDKIAKAKISLDRARARGDKLRIALAEDGLNDLLDRLRVTLVTRNDKDGQ